MKKMIWFLALAATVVSCQDRKNEKVVPQAQGAINLATNDGKSPIVKDSTTVEILDSLYNFGTVKEGAKVQYSFRFKNTGTKPLVIESASASCGCTVPEKPEQPIKPGEIGIIKVEFNSQGRSGTNTKTITVVSNASPEFPVLILKGEVEADKQATTKQ